MDVTPAALAQGEARRITRAADRTLADPAILSRAAFDALRKLNPARLARNPVIFVTEIVSTLVTVLAIRAAAQGEPWLFQAGIAVWLWLTVLFATFAEAVAEGAGRAQADSLRRARTDTRAKLLLRADDRQPLAAAPRPNCAPATWCWSRPAT
jgi:K+-transporting ATPase ATPase B chain